jgi:hypothetical protein
MRIIITSRNTDVKITNRIVLISGFRRDVDEICGLLGYYAASCGNCLPTFRDNVSVPSQKTADLRIILSCYISVCKIFTFRRPVRAFSKLGEEKLHKSQRTDTLVRHRPR